MPKTHRDLLKRQIAHAHNNIEMAAQHIVPVADAFQEAHPELYAALFAAVQSLSLANEIIEKFCGIAWGNENPDWEAWRNVPGSKKEADAD